MSRRSLLAGLLLTLATAATAAAAPSPQEQREKLLKQLGLPRDPPPATPAPDAPTPGDPPREHPPAADPTRPDAPPPGPAPPTPSTPPATPAVTYVGRVHALVQKHCAACHGSSGAAATSGYRLGGDRSSDYRATLAQVRKASPVRALVDLQRPRDSLLVRKAVGEGHGGGPTLTPDSAEHRALLRWIEQGALGPEAPVASPVTPPPTSAAELPVDAVTSASPMPTESRLGDGTPLAAVTRQPSPLPFSLPFHLQINGKIDFSYERRDYRDHPFKAGRNAFATYHHFIYLSRSGAKDPFGFNIELVTRQFYEVNARFSAGRRFRALIKAGKLLVPFGGEPLYHHSYGGRSGFDQEILPVVWARPGLGVQMQLRLPRGVTLANDVYMIAGHTLKASDTALNLQGDLANLDNLKPAFGDRLGLSWGPFTGWYSLYVSPLGLGRTLVMQAVDLVLWRPSKYPFLRDLVPSMGLMRADVSGGGRGEDYYHFGSYWSLAYTPIPYFTLQYRNGLRTHDNRRGVFYDPTRRDANDRGSHNLSVYGRYKGAYVGLQLFWNLEKAGELDDDFLRMTVGYAF